jgi:4-hydroxybenzoate polyprenyltransferase
VKTGRMLRPHSVQPGSIVHTRPLHHEPMIPFADAGSAVGVSTELSRDDAAERQTIEVCESARLYVDLDGTLVATDTLWESVLIFLRRYPYKLPQLLLVLLQGRAEFKGFVARHVSVDASALPYRSDVLEYLQEEHRRGRPLILATAAHRRIAESVAGHLRIFESIIATDAGVNLKGETKLQAILHDCCGDAFDYMGDSVADLPVFCAARQSHLVWPHNRLEETARTSGRVHRVFCRSRRSLPGAALRALRPHQWAKNVLVAVPLITSHLMFDPVAIVTTLIAFLCLTLIASGQYVLNDLLDLESDRMHHRKRLRPFASGELSVPAGLLLSLLLLLAGTVLAAAALPPFAAVWLGFYFVISLTYSLVLKNEVVLDVLVLAALFTVRVYIGGAALDLTVSHWLLMFSLFLFTSLAFLKRYVEALRLSESDQEEMAGRGYRHTDAPCIMMAGAANGYLAILVYALYVNSDRVRQFYHDPRLLWLGCPLLAYWVTRAWFLAHRNQMDDDPVYFALTDRASHLVGALFLALVALAM